MQIPIISHSLYILASLALTIWVARTLFTKGRIFLVESFRTPEMADSVNHLLYVGFYLVNIGFVFLFLRFGSKPETTLEALEYLSSKLGIVLLVLGAMHFFNMFNIAKMRSKATRGKDQHVSFNEPEEVS